MKRIFASIMLGSLSTAALAGPPPAPPSDSSAPAYVGVRTYTQHLTIDFASVGDAQKAVVRATPVFDGKQWALSARWDDNAMLGVPIHDAMVKHGIKGTFYVNQSLRAFAAPFVKTMQAGNCDVGVHTQTHPWLPGMVPNEVFWEMLSNRVERETDGDKPINTLAFPSGGWQDRTDPAARPTITQSFLRSGLTNTTYIEFAQQNPDAPQYEISTTHQVTPGDHTVNAPLFDKQMQQVLKSPEKMADQTHCISFGVHARQTGEELKKLDAIFEKYSGNPDWWYCTMNEYGAYDRQYHITRIQAQPAQGTSRTYTITRPTGGELGDSVPLTIEVAGGAVASVRGDGFIADRVSATGRTLIDVHQSVADAAPTKIDFIANDTNAVEPPASAALPAAKKFADVRAWLTIDAAGGKAKLSLENDGAAMSNVTLTLRLPLCYKQGIVRLPTFELGSGESKTIDQPLGDERPEPLYRQGRAYYVAEIDFVRGDSVNRLYATSRMPPAADLPASLRDAAHMLGPFPNDSVKIDAVAPQSAAGAALTDLGTTANLQWFVSSATDRTMYMPNRATLFKRDKAWSSIASKVDGKPQNYLVAADFDLSQTATLNIGSPAKVLGVALNGQPVAGEITAPAGKNRIMLMLQTNDNRAAWCVFPLMINVTPSAGTLSFTPTLPAK